MICFKCGHKITHHPYIVGNKIFCCENCSFEDQKIHIEQGSANTVFAEVLVHALDLREHETGMHSKRVACHTLVLARQLISDKMELQQIYWGALLHDIGKIGVSDDILLKPGPLTDEQWKKMKMHPENGFELVSKMPNMEIAAQIVYCHEERYDGSGYPRNLKREDIPLGARLFMVIDTLDAITSDRPYRKAQSFDIAKQEIIKMTGSQFDPLAVDAFLSEEKVIRDMVNNKCHLPFPEI